MDLQKRVKANEAMEMTLKRIIACKIHRLGGRVGGDGVWEGLEGWAVLGWVTVGYYGFLWRSIGGSTLGLHSIWVTWKEGGEYENMQNSFTLVLFSKLKELRCKN